MCVSGSALGSADKSRSVVVGKVRIWRIAYRAHNGARRAAFVAFPSSYRPGHAPPIPLVISPHGRGVSGRGNLKLWGQLPAVGGFGVVSPDGQGRLLSNYSWGSAGQIDDLARMPQIIKLTLRWVHVDAHRV
jgi:poly(3-hydroxybutyrate) depolymerase